MKMTTDKTILKEKLIEYFGDTFEPELIEEISKVSLLRTMPQNELLIDIGDKMTHIPLILRGVVKIIREAPNGEEIALYFLESGDTCAISFVNCIHRNESIFRGIVEAETEGIFFPVDKIDEWLKNFQSWRYFIIDNYHMRLLEMVDSIDSLAFMTLDDRILKYLIDTSEKFNSNEIWITHQEIANDNHTSRVVVSRLLKRLENQGKIKIMRNRVLLEYDQLRIKH